MKQSCRRTKSKRFDSLIGFEMSNEWRPCDITVAARELGTIELNIPQIRQIGLATTQTAWTIRTDGS